MTPELTTGPDGVLRSTIHDTTTIGGQYRKDPHGPHATVCYKDSEHLRRGTHVASHGYVRSTDDWTYTHATHAPEKPDSTKKSSKTPVWPTKGLTEISSIAFAHWQDCMGDQAPLNSEPDPKSADYASAMASVNLAAESSRDAEQYAQSLVTVEADTDTFVVVEEEQGSTFKLLLPDGSSVKVHSELWQEAWVLQEASWAGCYLYVSQKSGTRYWAWTLQPNKDSKGKGTGKRKGKK